MAWWRSLLALPLVFLVLQAAQAGWSQFVRLLFRRLTADAVWNTVKLAGRRDRRAAR